MCTRKQQQSDEEHQMDYVCKGSPYQMIHTQLTCQQHASGLIITWTHAAELYTHMIVLTVL